ncbi:MAG: FliH/SctL family protein [bacterium]
MVSTVLPGDAGAEFQPKEFERKEVSEESRAINSGKREKSEAGEFSETGPGPGGGGTAVEDASEPPSPEGEEDFPQEESAGQDIPEDAEKVPFVPHNPDFSLLGESDLTLNKIFSRWVVTEELQDDGTFEVIEEDGSSYQPEETPEEKSPEEVREEVLAEARAEAVEIRSRAKQEGYSEGHSAGLEEAREEVRKEMVPVFEELTNSIKSVLDYRGEILIEAEKEIFDLAVLFSRKVLHSELRIRPEVIVDVVRHALKRAVGWGEATVQVNPEDYEFLEKHQLLLSDESEGVVLVRIETNPGITRGGCILKSNFGEIDVRLEKQLEAVEGALREALSERLEEFDEAAREAGAPEEETVGGEPPSGEAGEEAAPGSDPAPGPDPASVKPYQPVDLGQEAQEAPEAQEGEEDESEEEAPEGDSAP